MLPSGSLLAADFFVGVGLAPDNPISVAVALGSYIDTPSANILLNQHLEEQATHRLLIDYRICSRSSSRSVPILRRIFKALSHGHTCPISAAQHVVECPYCEIMDGLVVDVVRDLDEIGGIACCDVHGVELLGDIVFGVLNEVWVIV
jgi:hypothetical protein